MHKKIRIITLLSALLVPATACSVGNQIAAPSPTALVYEDTFFSGYAFVDSNHNGKLDESDAPLQGASFSAAGFGDVTDAQGYASIIIPGGWDQPIAARMAPPEGDSFTPIGPTQVTLQNGVQNRADFLFALPEINKSTPSAEPTPAANPTPRSTPRPGVIDYDLTYCTVDNAIDLKMDVYYARNMGKPNPAILYVHGGSWIESDKDEMGGLIFARPLLKAGFTLVAINYRLAPKYKFPAQIEDVKCAVRYLRANAEQFNIDPERIGVMGASAGGHLASLLGLSDESAGWDTAQYNGQSSRVRAVVDIFGPSDLTWLAQVSPQLTAGVFGATPGDEALLLSYSPVNYISADDPPFLILHGTEDTMVPLKQSKLLYDRLRAAGVPVELVVVENAGHSLLPPGSEYKPSIAELQQRVVDFFLNNLD